MRKIITPISARLLSFKVGNGYSEEGWLSRSELAEKYNQCLAQKENADALNAKLKIMDDDLAALKKIAAFKDRTAHDMLTARVVGQNFDSVEKSVVISAGRRDGVKIEQPVVTGEGILVGRVAEVDEEVAIVRLMNDSHSKAIATILNRSRSLGIVEGGYGLTLRMKFIPRTESVMIGDQIITSGTETGVPKGLLIGTVAVVENEAYKPFQQAVVTPATDLSKLLMVSVLLTEQIKI